jgi:hypothetical protein
MRRMMHKAIGAGFLAIGVSASAAVADDSAAANTVDCGAFSRLIDANQAAHGVGYWHTRLAASAVIEGVRLSIPPDESFITRGTIEIKGVDLYDLLEQVCR